MSACFTAIPRCIDMQGAKSECGLASEMEPAGRCWQWQRTHWTLAWATMILARRRIPLRLP